MNRRGFLGAILAAGVAPAFIGSSVLMPVRRLALPTMDVLRTSQIQLGVGHGLRVGEWITISGSVSAALRGQFRVSSVSDMSGVIVLEGA